MKLYKTISLLALLSICNSAFAKTRLNQMEQRAAIYLLNRVASEQTNSIQSLRMQNSLNVTCVPDNNIECVEFVAGAYPNSDDRLRAVKACVGNVDKNCAVFVAGAYPNSDDRTRAAQVCRNNLGSDCAVFVAGAYPNSDDRLRAAKACPNVDVNCVKYVAGAYPNSDDRLRAAKACSGQ